MLLLFTKLYQNNKIIYFLKAECVILLKAVNFYNLFLVLQIK